MKTVNGNIIMEVNMNIRLFITKEEAKALQGIVGYGADAFLEVFHPKLGKAYLKDHETAMRSLFHKLHTELPIEVAKIEKAEKQINETIDLFKSK
ncbi:MAG TPA: hypothetical protein VI911_00085 [Patescibacteria group bacterium]|nr:hypothetical protein [Patescibacteria group bacterium]